MQQERLWTAQNFCKAPPMHLCGAAQDITGPAEPRGDLLRGFLRPDHEKGGTRVEPAKKIVDSAVFLPVIQELTAEGRELIITVTGGSMTPFLVHGRDRIRFRKPDRPLRRGDIAFFRRPDGACVLHRICRVEKDGSCWFLGDAQQIEEGPVPPEAIFAVVTEVFRKGRWLGPGDPMWEFFAHVWLRLRPLRPLLRRGYGGASRLWKGGGHGPEENS